MCRFSLKTFIFGVLIGVFLAFLLKSSTNPSTPPKDKPFAISYKTQAKIRPLFKKLPFDTLRYDNKEHYTESQRLEEKINVLCIILVKSNKNLKAARNTWARGCNKVQTIDLTHKKQIPKIGLKNKPPTSWNKLCQVLQATRKQDWAFIVNDSAFVILENLRLLVSGLDPFDQYYLGHPVQFWSTTYNSVQGGIVLSRGTLKALKTITCESEYIYNNREDYYLGKVLNVLGIQPEDTTDIDGLSIFNPLNLHNALVENRNNYAKTEEQKCCSKYLSTFHAIDGDKMYTYYYFIYTLQLFYTGNQGNEPIKRPPDFEIWGEFLKSKNIPTNITSEQYYKIWTDIVDDPNQFAKHLKELNEVE